MENFSMLDEGKSGYALRLIYNRNELTHILSNELALFSEDETLFCKISTKKKMVIIKSENPRIGLAPEIYDKFLGVLEDYVDPVYLQAAVMHEDERNHAIANRFYNNTFETFANSDIEKLLQYTFIRGYTKKKMPATHLSKKTQDRIDSQKIQIIIEEQEIIPLTKKRAANQGNQEKQSEDAGRSGCCNSTCCKGDDCYTHWGLKRWIYGIKEYVIDRCLCCATPCVFDTIDGDRTYIKESTHGTSIVTTDCCLVAHSPLCSDLHGWIDGTMCFPFAVLTHLISLPIVCCYPTKDDWRGAEAGRIEDCVNKHKDRQRMEAVKPQGQNSQRKMGSYGTMSEENHDGKNNL